MPSKSKDTDAKTPKTVGFASHNHTVCVASAMANAEAHCREAGLRFTPVRRKALEILLEEHRALGAYDVLQRLHEAGFGSQPPVAYRALDFLVATGFAHKVERLNAFIACSHPNEAHAPIFMICRKCDAVAESATIPTKDAFGDLASNSGFQLERTVLAAEGVCMACAAPAAR